MHYLQKTIYSTPLGYSLIISKLLFVGGLIMLMLGIIGEYIEKIYINNISTLTKVLTYLLFCNLLI